MFEVEETLWRVYTRYSIMVRSHKKGHKDRPFNSQVWQTRFINELATVISLSTSRQYNTPKELIILQKVKYVPVYLLNESG